MSRFPWFRSEHFENCGITTKRDRENGVRRVVEVGFHSLRHTFVSMCAMNNVPLSVVQSLVGHSSPLMTGAYSHSNRLAEQQAVAALPSINGDAAQPQRARPLKFCATFKPSSKAWR